MGIFLNNSQDERSLPLMCFGLWVTQDIHDCQSHQQSWWRWDSQSFSSFFFPPSEQVSPDSLVFYISFLVVEVVLILKAKLIEVKFFFLPIHISHSTDSFLLAFFFLLCVVFCVQWCAKLWDCAQVKPVRKIAKPVHCSSDEHYMNNPKLPTLLRLMVCTKFIGCYWFSIKAFVYLVLWRSVLILWSFALSLL